MCGLSTEVYDPSENLPQRKVPIIGLNSYICGYREAVFLNY
ncbi:hypothetical protein PORCAN_1951 [Porphyromonas crevioricanis JCM 13913]|nr:hypothetical protein PORCAN_1951 [Porphyromonas crevioricanis JCM 13913]